VRREIATKGTLLLAITTMTACVPGGPTKTGSNDNLDYPETATVTQVDEYHGVPVKDPYRWLEDDVRENPDVKAWVDAQNELTFAYLRQIPERNAIRARMQELWDFERWGLPRKKSGHYFFAHNNGLQNQDVVYTQDRLDGAPRLLLDPNAWSNDGTVALAAYYPSPDANYLAYLVQDGGSDWRSARVLQVANGEPVEDRLDWLKFTALSWASDSSGFYYSRYPAAEGDDKFQGLNMNQAVYFHRLGTPQDEDRLVYANADNPDWGYAATVSDDGAFLVITVWKGTDDRYQVIYQDLRTDGIEPVTLIEGFDHDYTFIGNVGPELLFRTTESAPRGRLIGIDVGSGGARREVVAQASDVLTSARLVGGRIVAEYLQDAWTVIRVFDVAGELAGSVDLPGIGTATGFDGDAGDPETFFSYESFNAPATIYRFDVSTLDSQVFRKPSLSFDPDDYRVEQVFFESRDGTRVPMFVAHHKDVVPDGARPTMLYGYGGFNISETPEFSAARLAWMEMGGVYAVANIRGGGEYGEAWHEAGTKLDKQNVFDDFIAAAEHLVEAGYTRPDKLAVFGGSNGGLLVGAVTNQRPDLFGAAIPAVGVMDMLRFQHFTAGRFWVDDYGSSDDPAEFEALYAYSPYHNIRPGIEYPAVMVTTADTDDRVVPGHSFKYAAALQAAQAGDRPVLIRIETRAGHGAGKPTGMIIEEYTDRWAFLLRNLGMRLPEGYGTP